MSKDPQVSSLGNEELPERVDIRTVARMANVSTATVSRTMNNVANVNPRLAKRVRDAVAQLNYFPSMQARAMGSGRSRLFGLIVSEMTNPFFPELIQGFEDIAVEHGYEILVSSTSDDAKRISQCVRRMAERKVEGVAVMTFGAEESLMDQLAQRKIPLVTVDAEPDRPGISLLKVDYQNGIRQGVQHLAVLGHRSIAFVSGQVRHHSAEARLTAFKKSLYECGISPSPAWIIEGNHSLEGGVAAMEELLACPERPTALMCSNDMTAFGVLHKLYREGLRVPDDFSLIGFDNIRMGQVMSPPLTTIQMSRHALARAAVAALRLQVESPGDFDRRLDESIKTELVVRESTGFPRGTMLHLRKSR